MRSFYACQSTFAPDCLDRFRPFIVLGFTNAAACSGLLPMMSTPTPLNFSCGRRALALCRYRHKAATPDVTRQFGRREHHVPRRYVIALDALTLRASVFRAPPASAWCRSAPSPLRASNARRRGFPRSEGRDLDLAARSRRQRRAAALVWHVQQVDAGHHAQHFAGEMR